MGVFKDIFQGKDNKGATPPASPSVDLEKPIDSEPGLRTFDPSPVVKRRGRPPGSKNQSSGSSGSSSSKGGSSVDPTYLVETVVTLFEIGDDVFKGAMLVKIKKWAPDKTEELNQILEKNCLTEADKTILRSTLAHLIAKYDILSKVGPEIGLLIFVGQYSFRLYNTHSFVESLKPVAPKQPKMNPPTVANLASKVESVSGI